MAIIGGAGAGAGCSDASGPPAFAGPTDSLLPLHPGARWTYAHTDSSTNQAVAPSATLSPLTVQVIGDTTSPSTGERFAILDSAATFLGISVGDRAYLSLRDAGLYVSLCPGGCGDSATFLLFHYPLNGAAAGASSPTTIGNPDTTITVPAGTFHCIRYDVSEGSDGVSSFFVEPHVGIIEAIRPGPSIVIASQTSGQTERADITNYLMLSSTTVPLPH